MATDKQLKAAAQEFIDVMLLTTGEEPNKRPIQLTNIMNREDYVKIITEAIPWIEPLDDFTQETILIIEEMEKGLKKTETVIKPKTNIISLEDSENIEDLPLATQEVSLEDEILMADKLKELKEIVVAEPQFKTIRGKLSSFKTIDALREEMIWLLNGSKPPISIIEQELPIEETQEEVANRIHENNIEKVQIKTTVPNKIEYTLGHSVMVTKDILTEKPFSSLFEIDKQTLNSIIANMKVVGFDPAYPIIMWENTVIDGHTRLEASEIIGITSIPILRKEFANKQEALEYAIHNQRDRRNLSEAELLRCIAIIDTPMTKEEAGKKGGGSNSTNGNAKIEPSHTKTAKELKISGSKVKDARTVLGDSEAMIAVESGKKTISGAAKEVREKKKSKKVIEEPTKTKKESPTQVMVLMQIIKEYAGKSILLEDIIIEADSYYAALGGRTSIKEMSRITEIVVQVLQILGKTSKIEDGTLEIY